jgi:CubicO group peptidase (beta-lactamase class C family)
MDHTPLLDNIRAAMEQLHVPGVAVGILQNNEVFAAGLGVTNVDHPLPVDDGTLFQIGSITKTFVGTLAMRLVEMGKLNLDMPVRAYLPDFNVPDEQAAANVTLRHLFTHTAGWVGDFFPEDLGHGDDAVAKYVARLAEVPQLTPVGEVLSYNNAGFVVAGRVIETVVGKDFASLMKEMIFEPLGLSHTYLLPWEVMTYRFVSGHTKVEDGAQVARPWSIGRASGPAGGIISNVRDLLDYARFQMGDGTYNGARLLKPESLDALHTPQVRFTPADAVCLTFWEKDYGSTRSLSHGGGTVGQITRLEFFPEQQFAIALFTNADSGSVLVTDICEWAFEHYLGVTEPKHSFISLAPEKLAAYAGSYAAALTECELSLQNGDLVARMRPKGGFPTKDDAPRTTEPSPPVRLGFLDEDTVFGLDAPMRKTPGKFIRNDDGSIAWFRFGGRIHRRMSNGKANA